MTTVASISATVGRLQQLFPCEPRPLGQFESAVESTVLRLQESKGRLMKVPAHARIEERTQEDLKFGRTTRSLLSSIEDMVESYALQLGSRSGSSREGCMESLFKSRRSGGDDTAVNKVVADLEATVGGLKACVTRYCERQNQKLRDGKAKSENILLEQSSKGGEKSQRFVSEASSSTNQEGKAKSENTSEQSSGASSSTSRRGDATFGLGEAVKKLTEVLLSKKPHQRVVFIVGMGGIGRTTLARELYTHHAVRDHFQGLAWVNVGDNSARDALVSIVGQFSPGEEQEGMKHIADRELAQRVCTILQGKRCLVVLDDCRSSEFLHNPFLRTAFLGRDTDLKFIITTRDQQLEHSWDEQLAHRWGPVAYTWLMPDATVGLDEAVSELTKVLLEKPDKSVVYIVGRGENVKTALAKELYTHKEVRRRFNRLAWVDAGNTTIRDALESIVDQLSSSSPRKEQKKTTHIDEEELARQVCRILEERTCLVVLDDCRNSKFLDSLRNAFPSGERSASDIKFIITTRDQELADRWSPPAYTWHMRVFGASSSTSRLGDATFGLDEAVKKLTEVLLNQNPVKRAVFIYGKGGLGKTTLAWVLFNHDAVRDHFKGFAWVDVGDTSVRGTLVSVIDQLSSSLPRKDDVRDIDDVRLARLVFGTLVQNSCLVVLDGCWSSQFLTSLTIGFPVAWRSVSNSKFIVTTRDQELMHYWPAVAYPWPMRLLDEKSSSDLFWHTLHTPKGLNLEIPEEFQRQTRTLLDRCGGLPSAIISLARTLRTERPDLWHNLLQQLPESSQSEAGTQSPALADDTLPLPLEACFLYLGTFPKNSRIQVEKSCQLWIAEGLISAEDRASQETMMDVAERYFGKLVERKLVSLQGDDEVSDIRLMSGRIDDQKRESCVAVGEKEEFFEIMERGESSRDQPQMRSQAQRCVIYFNRYFNVSDVLPSANLRSLLCLNSQQSRRGSGWPEGLFNFRKLGSLRVLDFDRVHFQDGKLPEGVGELVFLRYLSFRGCHLKVLPSCIGNFSYLQTLDLRVQKDCIMTISDVIWKLERLRNLYFPLAFQTPDHRGKLKLGSLKELEILEGLHTSVCRAEDLIELTNLRILAATAEGNLKDLQHIIDCIDINKSHLSRTSLEIKKFDCYTKKRLYSIGESFSCSVLDTLQIEGHIGKMPDIGMISPRFTKIVLNGSELDQDPMPTLEKLHKLRILVLEVEAYVGKNMNCSATGFPELRCLNLSKLHNLEDWVVEKGALPKLSTLEVSMCRRMKMLPEGLRRITTLRKLKISMMPQQFLGRLQVKNGRGGEDLHKINWECSVEFGDDDPWLESTNSASQ